MAPPLRSKQGVALGWTRVRLDVKLARRDLAIKSHDKSLVIRRVMDTFDKLRKRFLQQNSSPHTNSSDLVENVNDFSNEPLADKGITMTAPGDFTKVIDDCFTNIEVDKNIKDTIKKVLVLNFNEYTATSKLKERLQLLFEYEKNYLSLIKEFKEEIKFVGTLQEDLRKERAKFFSATLREVSDAMKDAQVSSDVASQWIKELVNSYTKSLDVSSGLIEEHTFDTIGDIRKQAKSVINSATVSNQENEKE